MSRLDGKVAFVTGGARGEGRSHAVRLAEEGCDIITTDVCKDMPSAVYDGPTSADLRETVQLVERTGRRIVAAETGLIGLMRALAKELAPHSIRVNTIHPGIVATPMFLNDATYRLFRPDLENPTREDFEPAGRALNALPVSMIEPVDVSNAVVYLASDDGRYVTGTTHLVTAGAHL